MIVSFDYRWWAKRIVFSFLPLVFLLLCFEVGSRYIYFSKYASEAWGTTWLYKMARFVILMKEAQREVSDLPEREVIVDNLYSEKGEKLLHQFEQEYEENFSKMVETVKEAKAHLVVVYLPSATDGETSIAAHSRQFYPRLAQKYGVDFFDFTPQFTRYPKEVMTLLPEDGHYSRYGYSVLAQALKDYLVVYKDHRVVSQGIDYSGQETGPFKPNMDSVWNEKARLPHRVITNAQGFRMDHDVASLKTKQRILALGDSYTFGAYVNNQDTWPAQLEKIYPDAEVINGGVGGYTITDEAALFIEKARKVEPDIVLLQVLDNDIYDLFYFKQNSLDREKEYVPSEEEVRFLNSI